MYIYKIFSLDVHPCPLLKISSHAVAFFKVQFYSTYKNEKKKMVQHIKQINVQIIVNVH